MQASWRRMKRAFLAFALLCNGVATSLAQTTTNEQLEKIGTRLSKLSTFLDTQVKTRANTTAMVPNEISEFRSQLSQVQSEISGLSASDASKRLEAIPVPPRVQDLLVLDPNGSKLPLPPHQQLGTTKIVSLEPYVVGPGAAATVDYPSVANITYAWAGQGHSTICTGTLISSNAVLTAAHCFCDSAGARTAAKCSSATYHRGLETLKPTDTKYFEVFFQDKGPFDVKEIVVNPEYNWPKKDLAILRLSTPVSNIMPAPLNDVGPVALGSYPTIVGFGVHSALNGPTTQQASAQPISSSAGLKLWATIKTAECMGALASEEVICWNYQPRAADAILGSTCHGDSGGPLFAEFNNEWRLAGVTSGGRLDCIFSSQPQDQSFDVDISRNLGWIRATANVTGSPIWGPTSTAFLLDTASRAYAVPYHLFTDQPDNWVAQFYLPAQLTSIRVSINATPTFSKLILELRPPNATASTTCRDERLELFCQLYHRKSR